MVFHPRQHARHGGSGEPATALVAHAVGQCHHAASGTAPAVAGPDAPKLRRVLQGETALTSNAELHAAASKAVARGVTKPLAGYAERAANAEIMGRRRWQARYRFASGISVINKAPEPGRCAEAVARNWKSSYCL